jgi:hypothetical protein
MTLGRHAIREEPKLLDRTPRHYPKRIADEVEPAEIVVAPGLQPIVGTRTDAIADAANLAYAWRLDDLGSWSDALRKVSGVNHHLGTMLRSDRMGCSAVLGVRHASE